MDDKTLVDEKVLSNSVELKIELKDGKIVASAELSGKMLLDAIAAKIGGPIPQAVAEFLESSLGLK